MSETKMELKIVFENYEDLNRKLYSLLYREDRRCCFPAKDQYKIEEIKNKIKMYYSSKSCVSERNICVYLKK